MKKKIQEPKPNGKELRFVLDLLNIDYSINTNKAFIDSINVGDLVAREYSSREIRELILAFKHLIKWDSLVKNLFLIKLISQILQNIPVSMLRRLRSCRNQNALSWSYIFVELDECLLLIVAFKVREGRSLRLKYEFVVDVYKAFFQKMQIMGISLEKFANEFVLNIGKLVILTKTDFNFHNCKPDYTRTINDIVDETFTMRYLKWNRHSVDYKKFRYLMTIIDRRLVKYLILAYLQLVKELSICSPNRKYLLTFLLIFNDIELIQFYQSISWII